MHKRFALAGASLLTIALMIAACGTALEQNSPAPTSAPTSTPTSAPTSAPTSTPSVAARPMPAPSVAATVGAPAPMMRESRMMGHMQAAPGYAPPSYHYQNQSAEKFPEAQANKLTAVADQPFSTFAADVDTASYAFVRRMLREGRLPPAEAVRVEEMVNYFPYDYAKPKSADEPFAISATVTPTPWNPDTKLLHIAVKGYDLDRARRPRANLVFLIDVSGSMAPSDRLPLLKQALRQLVESGLKPDDTMAIVTYAAGTEVKLPPTAVSEKAKLLAAIDSLGAGGGTAGAAGLQLAYNLAEQHFDKNAVNRIVLGTDGDFNIGISDPKELEGFIADKRKTGIYLSVAGVGLGNLNDRLMQRLAQVGNGNAIYVDSLLEARKAWIQEMSATFVPIADDLKAQIEFNPARVAEYRLVGYETRKLDRADFANDQVDAGEIGAGHAVTAIYEIVEPGSKARLNEPGRYTKEAENPKQNFGEELAFLRLRYKKPGESASRLIERPVTDQAMLGDIAKASADTRFAVAVAGFAQLLRGDPYLKDWSFADAEKLAQGARGEDRDGYRAEFVQLLRIAESLKAKPQQSRAE